MDFDITFLLYLINIGINVFVIIFFIIYKCYKLNKPKCECLLNELEKNKTLENYINQLKPQINNIADNEIKNISNKVIIKINDDV